MPEQTPLDNLYLKAKQVLGSEAYKSVLNTPPRRDVFLKSMEMDVKAAGGQEKVTDQMILDNLKIAHEAFPIEAEVLSKAFSAQTK